MNIEQRLSLVEAELDELEHAYKDDSVIQRLEELQVELRSLFLAHHQTRYRELTTPPSVVDMAEVSLEIGKPELRIIK